MKALNHSLHLVGALALLALVAGCSTDNPTAPPTPSGTTPGNPGSGSGSFTITVSANPPTVSLGVDPQTVQVAITVRRQGNNAIPANGTLVQFLATGGSFFATSGVTVDGSGAAGTAQLTNGSATLLFNAPEVAQSTQINVTLQGSIGSATVTTIMADEPPVVPFFISHLEPSVGPPAGGQRVDIHGSGFEAPVTVNLGGSPAEVLNVTTDRIRIRTPPSLTPVPAGSSLPVSLSLNSGIDGENPRSGSLANAFIYANAGTLVQPRILSITPTTGPNEGGVEVTIRGSGFEAPVQVIFRSSADQLSVEAAVVNVTSSEVRVLAPPANRFGQSNLNVEVDIIVRNLTSGFSDTAARAFRYGIPVRVISISPGEGIYLGADLVTIAGQGFDDPVAVTMGTRAQTVVSVSGSELVVLTSAVVVTSCNDISGPTIVVNIDTGDGATGPNFIYRVPKPIIIAVAPNSGGEAGGTVVTITGINFEPASRVQFGEQSASILSLTPTTIVVTVPGFSGTFEQEACDDNRDGTVGNRNVPMAVDVTVTSILTTCEDVFTAGFSYLPSDVSCQGDAGPPPPPPAPPVAAFSVNVVGTVAAFTDLSTGNPTSRQWDFTNDGTVDSTVPNPSHDYAPAASGTVFQCRLTVTNAGGSASTVGAVTIP